MVGRATSSGVNRVRYALKLNSLVSGSAGDESISAFTETGGGADVESAVPCGGAPEARKPVGERYTDSPARGAGSLGAPGGATATPGVALGFTARRCAASSEVTGGVAGGWYGCRLSERGLSTPYTLYSLSS